MSIAALLVTAKKWKQSKGPPMDEWKNKLLYILTMEYYSAIKSNEVNLESITASESSQSQKSNSV